MCFSFSAFVVGLLPAAIYAELQVVVGRRLLREGSPAYFSRDVFAARPPRRAFFLLHAPQLELKLPGAVVLL